MRPDSRIERVYLHRAPVDFRKQMDGLAALVEQTMAVSALSGSLFVFINRRRDKLKVLFWERNGFVVWYKRLEAERFPWPVRREPVPVELQTHGHMAYGGFSFFLSRNNKVATIVFEPSGYDVWRMRPHRTLHYRVLS